MGLTTRRYGVWLWIVVLAGTAISTGIIAQQVTAGSPRPAVDLREWALIGLALVVAGCLRVEVRHRGEIESFDVFEVALAPAICFLPGEHVVLLAAVAKAVSQLVLRMPLIKLGFNVAQWAACAGCGALTFAALTGAGHPQFALLVGMVVVAGTNLAAVIGLFGMLDGGAAVRQLLRPQALQWSATVAVLTTTTGLGITAAAVGHSTALLFVVALPVLLHLAGRGYPLARADLDRIRRLQAGTRALSAVHDVRLEATPFLTELAHSCQALGAELALRRHDGEGFDAYRYRAASRQESVSPAAEASLTKIVLAEPLPLHAVGQTGPAARWPNALRALRRRWPRGGLRNVSAGIDRPVVVAALRTAGWRDCLAVSVWIDGREAGMLAVYDRSGFADLDEADVAIMEAFSREVAAALQRAALVDEIVGARQDAARIVENSNDGIVTIAEDGSVLTWNTAFAALTGYAKDQVLGPGGLSLLDARDAGHEPVRLADWAAGTASTKSMPDEVSVRAVGGGRRWLSCSYARIIHDDGEGDLLVVIARDVTDLRRQRALITGQSHVMELIASGEPLGTSLNAVADLVCHQLEYSAAILLTDRGELSGLHVVAQAEMATRDGQSPPRLPSEAEVTEQVTANLVDLQALAAGIPATVDRSANSYWALPMFDAQERVEGVIVALSPTPAEPDVHTLQVLRTAVRLTEVAVDRDAARTRLTHQASHDPLTGLPNRTVFLDRCEQALHTAARFEELAVVLFVDLDRFKVINDSLGHDAGDRLLVAVAKRLRLAVRPTDTIARFGGDEFTILCERLQTPDDARILAERVLDLFATPFRVGGREVFGTASVGIALGCAPQRAEELVQDADAAMYRAKAQGGNRFDFFDEALRRESQQRLADYAALRRAVEGHEFEVHYQPTIALADGFPIGMEALARWRHPRRGLLHPDSFIDLAEETGLIVPMGRQILTTVLQEMPLPQPGQRPLRVSVNLSARQLTEPDLAAMVQDAIEVADVSPARLAFEITESVLLTDSTAMQSVIGQLKEIGVDLSLDDFGTGHSSMDYLKFLPVDELKIERRFVAGLLSDRRDRAIVSAIIHLAHDLGLRVVAEGIETAEQAELLGDLGCDIGQGYYFARPGPMPGKYWGRAIGV
ncbi:MAG TPA: EAL domain-containing protein [Kineosporiaceae bacterium]|nr:EAL domain-containing protein [Kineosporiaceae bacterium]